MKYTLNKLKIGTEAKIESLNCTGALRRRLLDLGLVKNTKIIPLFKSPSGDPTAYEIRGSVIALREIDSQNIEIMRGGLNGTYCKFNWFKTSRKRCVRKNNWL